MDHAELGSVLGLSHRELLNCSLYRGPRLTQDPKRLPPHASLRNQTVFELHGYAHSYDFQRGTLHRCGNRLHTRLLPYWLLARDLRDPKRHNLD